MLLTKRFRRAAALIVLAIATALSIAAAPAASADSRPADVQPQACGYSMDPHFHVAFYNHCTSDGSHIWIRVERFWPYSDYDQCVGPGTTGLGPAPPIYSAWYKGALC